MPPSRRAAIYETAENAARSHPEWSRARCLREAVLAVRKLEAIIASKFETQQ